MVPQHYRVFNKIPARPIRSRPPSPERHQIRQSPDQTLRDRKFADHQDTVLITMTEERLAEITKIKERKDYIERFLKKMDPTGVGHFKHGISITGPDLGYLSSDYIDEQFEKDVKELVIATHLRYVEMLNQALSSE